MWPFKKKPNKILKEMKKKEDKIQKLTKDGERLAKKDYNERNATKLASLDDKITTLKEEMIKMGKLVLKNGKLMKVDDKQPVENKVSIPPQTEPMVDVPPLDLKQPNPINEMEQQKIQQQISEQQLAQQEMAQKQMAQKQMIEQEETIIQQQLAEQQELIRQQQMSQAQQTPQVEQQVSEQVQPGLYIKLVNGEELSFNVAQADIEEITKYINDCIDNNKTIQLNNTGINSRNVSYFKYV